MDSFTKSIKKLIKSCDCNYECNARQFKQNFKSWTSGNDHIDKFIQNNQLSDHSYYESRALEWIPYDRLCDVKYITNVKVYKAKWIDGYIVHWDDVSKDWKRNEKNMSIGLKIIDNPSDITLEFMYKISEPYKVYGITQDPETKNYMVVYDANKCKKCNIECNATRFQQKFVNWTSGNNDIDKLIQESQLSTHFNYEVSKVLEWIPNRGLHGIKKYKFSEVYKANWVDGKLSHWDDNNQNWGRDKQNIFVILKTLNDPASITSEFINEISAPHKVYGITQNPETKDYMVVLNDMCEKCEEVCNSIQFQRNFRNWTSGNNDIDELIQESQLSAHYNASTALEWVPDYRFYDIVKDKLDNVYRANWIDGNVSCWDNNNQNWRRDQQNMFVVLKVLNDPASITSEFINEIATSHKVYGITRNQETKNYMLILDDICEKCNVLCNSIYFRRNFKNWTSGNDDINKFIQDSQLLAHENGMQALEWIPYNRFRNIKYIAKGGFGSVYRATWIDGFIDKWDNEYQLWKRKDQNMLVALKILNNSKNITLEFMNEIALHYKVNLYERVIKFYGITQDPETENYIMVLDYAENGNLRNYLDTSYNKLSWSDKIHYLNSIAHGIECIHEKELIHRDLHIGNILRLASVTCLSDIGLCKPVDYKLSENGKNKLYGVLPYIAPEILRGQNYTKAADIYSFGIIMYEVISGLPPYHDVSHDNDLAIKICKGLRPRFNIKVPQLIVHLIKRCLDADPLKRPTAEEIKKNSNQWFKESFNSQDPNKYYVVSFTKIREQIEEAEVINNKLSTSNLSYETHSEAIYTSRLLDFDNLPEPKNSDDYYEENDNIVSVETLESLQFDISKLKNINDPFELKNSNEIYEKNDDINMKHSESLKIDISQLKFNNNNNFPETENSGDYYEENGNMISTGSIESLQIDITQLNIGGDGKDGK
ncbi:kinase-like domain-containing protein [Rhizophagus diaphanus]|nr:kinase-like domain-containing protein [Rhizophagus diaphanus] [Rhizophagus sp. MUCL 43196]